jgi:hypothetical protein
MEDFRSSRGLAVPTFFSICCVENDSIVSNRSSRADICEVDITEVCYKPTVLARPVLSTIGSTENCSVVSDDRSSKRISEVNAR